MTDYFELLENELRGALISGAHRREGHAVRGGARLGRCELSSTPRLRGRLRAPWSRAVRAPWSRAALALAGGGAGTVLVLAIVGLGAGVQQAFAGWSASPTSLSPAARQTAEAACDKVLGGPGTGAMALERATGAQPSGWTATIGDMRGPYVMLDYEAADGDARATCLYGASGAHLSAFEQGGTAAQPPLPDANGISVTSSLLTATRLPGGTEHQYSEISGRAGAQVSAVAIVLSDGTTVTATTEDERFLAWWPSAARAVSAQLSTSSGTSTVPLP